jgi:antitoxin HicB
MQYPAHFEPDTEAGGYVVTFRDIPEAITQGDDEAEAMTMAEEVLISAIEFYLEDKRQVPPPSKAKKGERIVSLPAGVTAKVLLLNEMLAQGIGSTELARRMGTIPQNVNRLIDVRHASKLESIEKAVEALGKRLELSLT